MTKKKNRPGTFKKGDPRINRNGRPRSFDKLRTLAQQIAHEEAKKADGETIIINGNKVTQIEALMRQLIRDNPKLFLEYAFGKPKEEIDIKGDIEHIVKVVKGVSIDDL